MLLKEIHGSCLCASNEFEFKDAPIARFNCHCKVCQSYSGRDYSDVSVFLRHQLSKTKLSQTEFKRFKLPPNIRRGVCKHCHKPSIELGILGQLVFVPTSNLKEQDQIEPASMHIFYHRRVKEVNDNLPKYSGFMQSQLKVVGLIMQGLYRRIKK